MYKYAITRKPAPSSINGLTTVDLGPQDYDVLLQQHQQYKTVLARLGVEVIELDTLDQFPDSYFTEDTAIVTPEVAVIMRPGADTRRGEIEFISEALSNFRTLQYIKAPGMIDGGDVLVVGKHCIIGLSERTNQAGAEQLGSLLGKYAYKTDIVDVPQALHFKSSVNFLDQRSLLVTQSCWNLDCLSDYRKFVVPEGEEYAANVVWINGHVLMADGFPGTERLLRENGYEVIVMPVTEIAKMDGGLTCLSLRLT